MKVEYLNNTDPVHPKDSIIRIFDFDSHEACLFRNTVSELADGSAATVDLGSLPFVESVGRLRLFLRVGEKDEGVIPFPRDTYECILTKEAWEDVQSLVEPFCRSIGQSTYQWLYNLDTDIELLFSPSGHW
jgi:hypothetical protein